MNYDVIIIGGGAAGFSAGMYTSRRGLTTLIISKDAGGQALLTAAIENYPGIDFVDGRVLMQTMRSQAERFGSQFVMDEVKSIEAHAPHGKRAFVVATVSEKIYHARAVILAFGMSPKNLEVPGEAPFVGHGIVYSAVEDPRAYSGKRVVVVGGGNSALEAARALAPVAGQVTLVHRRNEFRGDAITEEQVRKTQNVSFVMESTVIEVLGGTTITGVRTEHLTTHVETQVACDAIVVAIGHSAKTQWLGDLVAYDAMHHIIANAVSETKTPGLFAAGDSVSGSYKQLATASGDGVRAALRCYQYLTGSVGKILPPDWDIKKDGRG